MDCLCKSGPCSALELVLSLRRIPRDGCCHKDWGCPDHRCLFHWRRHSVQQWQWNCADLLLVQVLCSLNAHAELQSLRPLLCMVSGLERCANDRSEMRVVFIGATEDVEEVIDVRLGQIGGSGESR